jgi:Calcineurin-like phosphoesterase
VTLAWWGLTRPTAGHRVPAAQPDVRAIAQITLPPVGDASVPFAQPGPPLGGTPVLLTASRPETRSYLAFSVEGVSGPITRAILRLWSDRADPQGIAVHPVQGAWDEQSITAANAPAIGGAASTTGPVAAGTWAFADVTGLVPGHGLMSLALTQLGSGTSEFGSKEGAHSPELLVQTQLTRYPYLTDVAGGNATVNFGTDQSNDSAVVKWGRAGAEPCTAHTTTATKTSVMVNGVGEYQWKALLSPLRPDTAYCYRPYFGTPQIDLLRADPPPRFVTQLPAGEAKPFSFAVIGDWGQTSANGNPDQANVMRQLAASGARFVLGTGDTGYPAGSQASYGDMQQSGPGISTVFGPRFWTVAGRSLPMFNAIGNHAPTGTFLLEWPAEAVAAASGGQYQMESYCCVDGIAARDYGTGWYAFDQGNARFYILDAAWDPANLGKGSQYRDDYDAHWAAGAQHDEYTWLRNDLAAHPAELKFAVFHYPLHSDQSSQPSDGYLDGPAHLEGLLSRYHVAIAFNGHAHIYQRNTAPPGSLISYVTGGGGGPLMKIGGAGCAPTDSYGIGWDPSAGTGSRCGRAPRPASASHVYHFLLVTVNGNTVTVRPTDETGRTFDVQTYTFARSADTTHIEKNWDPPP